ncbi:thiamine ABC transporter permease, partial [Citrobacter portucalensis]|nr:thiamine ABC transporter permease [Citrobacter portucalensis]
MATPLRYALILLLWAIMAAVYLPLAPAAWSLITPAPSTTPWLAPFSDPPPPPALLATLVFGGLPAGGAPINAPPA